MSKRKDKKDKKGKKEEINIIDKYFPPNRVEDLGSQDINQRENIQKLNLKMNEINSKIKQRYIEHIKGTEKLCNNLFEKQRENALLQEEIREIKNEKDDFEKNCKENFEKEYMEIQSEKINAIENIKMEMTILENKLDTAKLNRDKLAAKVKKLQDEIVRLKNVNTITIQNYENKLKDLEQRHKNNIKNTTEKFENFLKNNQELLSNDLYTVYRNLKLQFELKLKECVDFRKQINELEEKNREYKLDMDNNEDIINVYAKEQVETKKKTEKLKEELENINKIIEIMKNEYQKQVDIINNRYTLILGESDEEIQNLKNEIEFTNRQIKIAQQFSKEAISTRSEIELFFLDQLKECRKEILKKRKKENEKKNYLPYINKNNNTMNINNNSTMTQDDSLCITSKKVDIKDMDPEVKEKLLRGLLIKINERGIAKGFQKLRNEIK